MRHLLLDWFTKSDRTLGTIGGYIQPLIDLDSDDVDAAADALSSTLDVHVHDVVEKAALIPTLNEA